MKAEGASGAGVAPPWLTGGPGGAEASRLSVAAAGDRPAVHHPARRSEAGDALKARERYADRRPVDRAADAAFLGALWERFGEAPFERGNLDAGRLGWLLGREVVPAVEPFDPADYAARLRIDAARARVTFPEIFGEG